MFLTPLLSLLLSSCMFVHSPSTRLSTPGTKARRTRSRRTGTYPRSSTPYSYCAGCTCVCMKIFIDRPAMTQIVGRAFSVQRRTRAASQLSWGRGGRYWMVPQPRSPHSFPDLPSPPQPTEFEDRHDETTPTEHPEVNEDRHLIERKERNLPARCDNLIGR